MDEKLKEKLRKTLYAYLGFNEKDGTYLYWLTRVKEAFAVGNMTFDDFVEVDEDFVEEIIALFDEVMYPKEPDI